LRRILISYGAVGAVAIVVLAGVFLFFITGCSGSTDSTDSSGGGGATQEAASSTSSENSEDSTNKAYAVGDTVDLADRTLTVNEGQVDYLTFDQGSWPKPGHQFVRANVTLTNTSTGDISFTPFDFQLEDASGVQRGYTIVEDMPNPLRSGNLSPNDAVTGNIAFDAPEGDAGFKLIYKPLASPSETATVTL
jgi:hypothetical protein